MKRTRPNLKKALKKIEQKSDHHFGNIDIDFSTLPCLKKPEKEKITANFDKDLLDEIKVTAEKLGVPYTSLMNDVLREVFTKKKTGS